MYVHTYDNTSVIEHVYKEPNQTKPNQTKPNQNQTKRIQTKTRPNHNSGKEMIRVVKK
jgi:hypothetical protein